jgi:hypothetical protein
LRDLGDPVATDRVRGDDEDAERLSGALVFLRRWRGQQLGVVDRRLRLAEAHLPEQRAGAEPGEEREARPLVGVRRRDEVELELGVAAAADRRGVLLRLPAGVELLAQPAGEDERVAEPRELGLEGEDVVGVERGSSRRDSPRCTRDRARP